MIRYAKSKSNCVALKPTVNCKNGVWRAYISFFEKDVPCEPKWENGFAMWEWAPVLLSRSTEARDTSYEICIKPVQEVIKDYYGRDKRK